MANHISEKEHKHQASNINTRGILITGGAGFIGSNLVEKLLNDERVKFVRVLDNLSTGFLHNIQDFLENPRFQFIQGDIRDLNTCMRACHDIDLINHQAALGSVPLSINEPLLTNSVNITGTLNIFNAAKEHGIKRIVFAASSSTYGDIKELPHVETKIGNPLSPYAVTKYVNELYAKVYSDIYGIEYIGLRYFNIFGPKQDPNGAYAAVIPLFMKAAIGGKVPTINGDGTYSRDFTYIDNAVEANILGLFVANSNSDPDSEINKSSINQIYNIACGEQTTLNQLWEYIQTVAKVEIAANHGENRHGDIPHSVASIAKAHTLLGYSPKVTIQSGLQKTYEWFKINMT